jgi:hypothetical protein
MIAVSNQPSVVHMPHEAAIHELKRPYIHAIHIIHGADYLAGADNTISPGPHVTIFSDLDPHVRYIILHHDAEGSGVFRHLDVDSVSDIEFVLPDSSHKSLLADMSLPIDDLLSLRYKFS